MFNKTAILRDEKRKNLSNSKSKNISYSMKKSLTNLKISFANKKNSLNKSNNNLIVTPNSEINSEFFYFNKDQNHPFINIFSLQFDNKNKKISQSKASSAFKKPCLNEKLNMHFNNKIRSRSHVNTEENEIHNKAYYLTGEVPFKDKYIIEMEEKKYCNQNLEILNKSSKNEIIQCETINNNQFNKKILNIRKKDNKIDRLAQKLSIKLKFEEKKNKFTKCGCGNLITFNNGFFNGLNLVMSYSPIKSGKEKDTAETLKNSYNQTEPGVSYNFIPTNLPIFLRDKFNIKGTDVLSPFCLEARDEFLFKKIFYEGERKRLSKRSHVIDNKLNIFYAENHTQYYKNLRKLNEKMKKKGKKGLHVVEPTPTEKKLNTIKNKMSFMKKIVDYAYPNMVLARVREKEKVYKKDNLSEFYLPPFKKAEVLNQKRNNTLGEYLTKSINIKNSLNN